MPGSAPATASQPQQWERKPLIGHEESRPTVRNCGIGRLAQPESVLTAGKDRHKAGIAQLVERLPSKQNVAGSKQAARSRFNMTRASATDNNVGTKHKSSGFLFALLLLKSPPFSITHRRPWLLPVSFVVGET